MFNFGRRNCCNKHHHDPCRDRYDDFDYGHNNCGCDRWDRNDKFDDMFDHCKENKPKCHKPVCFNVCVKKEKCRKFDPCNSYPKPHFDKCEKEVRKVCCFFEGDFRH